MTQCPSIFEQTGWRRPYPKMILQDVNILLKINKFSFDLCSPGFVEYVKARVGIDYSPGQEIRKIMIRTPGAGASFQSSWLNSNLSNHKITKQEYLKSRKKLTGLGFSGKTQKDLDIDWKIFLIQKAKNQDCWELFQSNETKEAACK